MGKQAAKNVLMKDGTARRRPADECERLLDTGQAKHYISNTVYRAMKFGIEVKNPKTRDEDGKLRAQIKDARARSEKRRKKKEEQEARKAQLEAEKEAHAAARSKD